MRPALLRARPRAVPPAPVAFVTRARHPIVFVALAAACAGHTPAGGRSDSTLITRAQIIESHYRSAYEVVEALHGNWLRARGTDSFHAPAQVVVYMDDSRLGGVDALRAIAATTVGSIRFIDAVSAQARWGIGHTQGVIYVTTQVGS